MNQPNGWMFAAVASSSTLSWGLFSAAVLGALSAWIWRQRRSGRPWADNGFAGWLVLDLAILFLAFDNVPRLMAGNGPDPLTLAILGAFRIAVIFALDLARRPTTDGWRWLCGQIALAAVAVAVCRQLPGALPYPRIWLGLAIHTALAAGVFTWSRRPRGGAPSDAGEITRVGILLLVGLVIAHPWFNPLLAGTGDAKLYAETMQDFLNQIHAGIWPPLVSQSEVAPFGAVFPFRLATYHYYLGALIDFATGRTLTVYAVGHAAVALSLVAGGVSMYAVLRMLLPKSPWLGCGMAALYLMSPAWLGPLYAMTMFYTTMALPFLPLAVAGAHADFGARNTTRAVLHGAALAATWHAHPPIGFWTFAMVGIGQMVGLVALPGAWRLLPRQALAWLVCAVLCGGLWYSASSLRVLAGAAIDLSSVILSILHSTFPATIQPAQANPGGQADLQLGYSLVLALALALLAAGRRPRRLLVWLVPALLLFVLLVPVPGITGPLWRILPPGIQHIAGTWPTQRLLPPLATLAAVCGALALELALGAGRLRRAVPFLMGAMLIWSALEAGKYVRRGYTTTLVPALSSHLSRPENSPLLINWLAFVAHPVPSVYQEGIFFDARLFNRVWSADRTRVIVDNFAAVTAGDKIPEPVPVTVQVIAPNVWRLLPYFEIEPGRPYLLQLQPTRRTLPGTFIMSTQELQRTATTLAPGGPDILIHFSASHPAARTVEMVFIPSAQGVDPATVGELLRYRLMPYDPWALPIRLVTFAPYRASLILPEAGWLETHRMYLEGYRATVNGAPAEVKISADSRLMIKVPAGPLAVRLDYVGSPMLRGLYAAMGLGWALFAGWAAWLCWRYTMRPPAPATSA